MDSTKVYINNVNKRIGSLESALNNFKAVSLNDHKKININLEELKSKNNLSLWTPIIAALIAAVIGTLLAQLIDRFKKRKTDEGKELREIKSKCVNILVKLKESYRQLAMYKFHTQYWWHCHANESVKKDSEAYYTYHLNSQLKAQTAEEKIGELNADFYSEITKYERLKGKSFIVDTEKGLIESIVFRKAKEYDSSVTYFELRNKFAETDEKDLRDSYYVYLQYYRQVINKM